MTIPLIAFCLGILIIIFTFLLVQNKLIIPKLNKTLFLNPYLKIYFIVGNLLIATALMLGLLGYFSDVSGELIRAIRIILGSLGLFSLIISSGIVIKNYNKSLFNKIQQNFIFYFLTFAATIVLISLFLTAFFDAKYGGDGFWYHLPFAARIWGFIPPKTYTFEEILEYRYLGLPLLANWFQGLFWFIFQRPEAANLLCYFSLISFIAYLRFYLKVPFYLATISLLAVPMVHMHSTKMYIDLPTNVFASITILTVYIVALKNFEFNKVDLALIFGSAFLSANMKFQPIPILFIMLSVFTSGLLVKIWLNSTIKQNQKIIQSLRIVSLVFLASLIVFFTCVKNVVRYQNPFYPMKLEIAGVVLNNDEENVDVMHDDIRKYHRSIRWVRSLLEIEAFDDRRPWPWTLGMDYIGRHERTFGVGGYFGGYVVFNILVFAFITWRFWGTKTQYGLLFFIPISLFTSYLPEAYKLRYYMYWILFLISLNTYYITYFSEKFKTKIIKPIYFCLVALGFMLAFMSATRYWFTEPDFEGFKTQLERTDIIDQELLTEIKNGEHGKDVCLIGKTQFGILYTTYFHPEYDYSIRAELDYKEDRIKRSCGDRKVVR